MATTELDTPTQSARWLLIFTWGSNTLRLTDRETDQTEAALGGVFTAAPSLEIELPANTGDLDERPLILRVLRDSNALFQALTSGESHAPVTVKIYEQISQASGSPYSTLFHYWGRFSRVVGNTEGREGLVRIEALTLKSDLEIPMGLPCTPQCVWTLGDHNCLAILPLFTGTVASLPQTSQAILTGVLPNADPHYYERGYLHLDGLRIGIAAWDGADPTLFTLRTKVPQAWIGQVVGVVPGCDKTIATCRSRYNREETFGGFGFGIPDHQPNIESSF